MALPIPLEPSLRHAGTGRTAAILRTEDFSRGLPAEIKGSKYVLFVASGKAVAPMRSEAARSWLDAGAAYVCAWGPSASQIEEAFDYASFLPQFGPALPFTVMTTCHASESLEEALWFAFYNATPPDDLKAELNTVLIVVDSSILEAKCKAWVLGNTE
jgi:hypothetical protein